jgi:hypothetical protein
MKRALLILALLPSLAFAQNSRFDYQITTVTGSGQQLPVLALPFALITFYSCTSGTTCGTLATTYPSSNATSACTSGNQVVLQKTGACTNRADAFGNFGAWLSTASCSTTPCLFAWKATAQYGTVYGPYVFSLGGGGSGTPVTPITLAMPTSLAANTCTTPVATPMNGLQVGMGFTTGFTSVATAIAAQGWGSVGGLVWEPQSETGQVFWAVCNQNSIDVNPGALGLVVNAGFGFSGGENPVQIPVAIFSAAGTPLPSCVSALNGAKAIVSDATAPTYHGAYTSGGAITSSVICSYNGSTYSWLTN